MLPKLQRSNNYGPELISVQPKNRRWLMRVADKAYFATASLRLSENAVLRR
jgi:hypothetical protein